MPAVGLLDRGTAASEKYVPVKFFKIAADEVLNPATVVVDIKFVIVLALSIFIR